MAQIFAAFGKSLGNNKGSVQNFGIVGVTIASEEITKFIFFFCPCDYPNNQVYGSIFIWGPAAVLFIVGYLVNRRTWRLTTGLCNRTQGIGKGGKRIFHFIFIFMSIGVKALIAPATWVVLAFLKGDYYACARWPNPDNPTERATFNLAASNASLPRPCMFNPNPVRFDASEAEVIARNLRAESHVIGWFYLCIGMFLGVVSMFIFRCKSKYSYEQSNYIDRYRQSEIKLFEDELESKAEEQAKRIVEGYFKKPRAKEEWDQIAVINDKVTRSKRGRAIYSPLHKFVNRELRAAEDASADVGLVSDAAMKTKRPFAGKKKPANNASGGGNAPTVIPMGPMGGSKKTVLKTQKPVEMKKDTFEEAKNQQTPAQEKTAQPKEEIVPDVKVVDPSKPATSASPAVQIAPQPTVVFPQPTQSTVIALAIPPPPQKQDLVAPPVHKPRAPTPVEEPTEEPEEKRPAVRETSLGDFGGTYSREDLRVPDDDDEDPVPVGDKVILFEKLDEEEDGGAEGMEQVDGGQENEVTLQADDEEPLLSED